jgi:hypothetical protein
MGRKKTAIANRGCRANVSIQNLSSLPNNCAMHKN